MRLFEEYGTPSTAGDITYIDYLFLVLLSSPHRHVAALWYRSALRATTGSTVMPLCFARHNRFHCDAYYGTGNLS
jgi:hypothetical protein